MNKERLKNRTKVFALNTIKLCSQLPDRFLANHIKRQLIRSSTSVAANYRAACLAQSKASFSAKLSIVIEEADESEFWLELLEEEKLGSEAILQNLKQESHELASIFISARKTMNLKN